jgi:hypothetical protein
MVLEQELVPFLQWLPGAAAQFLITLLAVAALALVAGFLVALVRHGPLKAGDIVYRVVALGFVELGRISPRRVWALARLAIKETIRRNVVVALVVFAVVLLFAGWFLRTDYREPGKLFLSFALTTTTYLILLIALLISAFSLPMEFKSKTIYTVVTKPVRAGEIVLGRILGFTLIGTVLLLIMAAGSYVFVLRMLAHTHEVEIEALEPILDADGNTIGRRGQTTLGHNHRHEVLIDNDGNGVAVFNNGHEHAITAVQGEGQAAYRVSGPLGTMRARVPYYGKLRFLDRNGADVARGVNTGSEWTYRSFIDGGTSAAAIWTFDGIDSSKLTPAADGSQALPLEWLVRVFRTHKGIIGQGIQGAMQLRNPDTGLKSSQWTFTAKDAGAGAASTDDSTGRTGDLPSLNTYSWPRTLDDENGNPVDLLDDLVTADGRLEVRVVCLANQQYFGFAQPDCYVRLSDASPFWNFCKAQLSIWVQMLLVISIAVAISTVVNGPVAMLFTVSFIALGFFRDFFIKVATDEQQGGGPIEALVRTVTQRNLVSPLSSDPSPHFGIQLMQAIDDVLQWTMLALAQVLPDFRSFGTVDYIAYGFNIPWNKVLQDITIGLAYVAGVFVLGYFFLRTREVAK